MEKRNSDGIAVVQAPKPKNKDVDHKADDEMKKEDEEQDLFSAKLRLIIHVGSRAASYLSGIDLHSCIAITRFNAQEPPRVGPFAIMRMD